MTHVEIPITAYSVQSAHAGRKYGQLAVLPLLAGADEVYFRAPLTKVPAGATVTSAVVRFYGRADESGSRQLNVQPTSIHVDSNINWSKKPASSGTTVTVTKASPKAGDAWDFNVTASVQSVVSGTRVDFGWRLWEDATTTSLVRLFGSKAATRIPVLIVDYTTVPDAPSNLHPAGGSVSVAKPTVTFDADDKITALQVQVDPASNATTPGFDSGSTAAAGGLLDLSATTYAGLAAGATTYWRARQQTGGGWSPWSDWVAMTRQAKPTLTLLAPAAGNVDDGTPPVQWSFAGTQVAWQARLLDASGDVLADSGYTPGTDTAWTPDKGLTSDGQAGTVEVLVWDNTDRVATPGDPEYVRVTAAIVYALDATVAPLTSLAAEQPDNSPDVVLSGFRSAIPDQVVIFRDDKAIATLAGTDVFTGQSFRWTDTTPPTARPVTYRVAPRVNGKTAKGGPVVTVIPVARGIWLTDLEGAGAGARVFLKSRVDAIVPDQSQPETSIVHTPLNPVDGAGQVVRRKIVRYRDQGTIGGGVLDEPADAIVYETLLREWALRDAGHLYWLTFGGFSQKVIIGDIAFSERSNLEQETRRIVDVAFNYWGQA